MLQLILNPSELTWDDTLADTLHKPIQITSHSLHAALSCHSENTQMIYNKIEVTRYFQSINMSVKTNFKTFEFKLLCVSSTVIKVVFQNRNSNLLFFFFIRCGEMNYSCRNFLPLISTEYF